MSLYKILTKPRLSYQRLSSLVLSQPRRYFSDSYSGDSVTYSGGQATQGQGGFYGSGGSRLVKSKPAHHPEALARVADIKDLIQIMENVEILESELRSQGNVINARTIEIKARIKKTISNPKVLELLNRLEINGSPVWGLSAKERDLVRLAREKYAAS
eukprot:gene4749-5204_t